MLEEEQRDIFTGTAISIRFPDFIDEKKKNHQFNVITFPEWAHDVYLGDNRKYTVLGKDLQIGMAFNINGILFPIVDITEQLYHGEKKQNFKIGYACNIDDIKNYNFTRTVNQQGVNEWKVSSNNTTT